MKKAIFNSLQVLFIIIFMCNNPILAQTSTDETWTKEKAVKWLHESKWGNGLKLHVYDSVNALEFAKQYHANKSYWDKALAYLKNNNLDTLSPGKYPIDGDNVFASVTINKPKVFEATKWEAHRKYIDIQYVIRGKEKMGVAPLSKTSVVEPYNETKDVGFYNVTDADSRFYIAVPGTYLIFFPQETHRPNIKIEGCDEDKKIVIKVRADEPVTVGLDNWYNHETNAKTGKPFHYLWTDSANSGYSRWGNIFTNKEASIKTLNRPDAASLAKLDVYIIVDPDTTSENSSPNYIEPEDADIIEQFVKNGGVLVILANDAPNCEFTHLNQLASRFGIVFNYVTRHPVKNNNWDMGSFTTFTNHPIFKGVKKIYLKEISSLKLTNSATPVLTENNEVFMAECQFGKGYVFAVGDPWIYNEYMDHERLPQDFDNRKAAENLTDYLLMKAKANKTSK